MLQINTERIGGDSKQTVVVCQDMRTSLKGIQYYEHPLKGGDKPKA